MPELLKEVITHYNTVHDANLSVSKLDMLKLNMIQLKKVCFTFGYLIYPSITLLIIIKGKSTNSGKDSSPGHVQDGTKKCGAQ